ncbi:FAD-dependent oxidoreductase [Microbacteriaceae bacterium VKM Ac-2855]|nr:FAD-dependent oxidoreductase [Microbacteriaceae bacterium VKM Ac-2855]
MPMPTIAVIGSGPSGCYTAQFLRKRWRDAEITVFDRLTLPYGLVRYGVAPDHHGTKAVARQFDRLFERDGVRFVGGTEIGTGTGLTLERIRAAFDIVVLATGLYADRPLTGPGADLPQVYGSGRLTRLINGHPDESADGLVLGERVVIVGHGNVSIDILRLFLTDPETLTALEIDPAVVDAIRPVTHIDIVGRSMPLLAKFDTAMVRELGRIPDVRFRVDGLGEDADAPEPEPSAGARRDAVASLVAGSPVSASRTVHFHFGWSPEAVLGTDSVTGITFRAAYGGDEMLTLESDSICTAIGFAEAATAPVRRGDHESATADLTTGYLDDGLYCVGWLRRGPRGTIPENRADARMVADVIAAAVDSGALVLGKPGYAAVADIAADIAVDASSDPVDSDPTTLHDLITTKELS